jgi:hypothetical protein
MDTISLKHKELVPTLLPYQLATIGYQERSRGEVGLHLDSEKARSDTAMALTSAHNCMKQRTLSVVARDGIAQHYTAWRFPTAGIVLDPRLSVAA